jgi:hypothetical protein
LILRTFELLQFLFEHAEIYLRGIQEYEKLRITTLAMVQQSSIEWHQDDGKVEKYYFRHDGIYVALSLFKAVTYASSNKFGSEILQRCIDIYVMLRKNNTSFKIPGEINISRIDQLIKESPIPVIIEVKNINEEDLLKEDGKTGAEALNFLRTTLPGLNEKDKFLFLQHCNFELLKPVPCQQLSFYKLTFQGRPGNSDFTYKLSDIDITQNDYLS